MLFDKYQYRDYKVITRGYSQNVEATNEDGTKFWVKWLLGIEKNDTKSKILADKIRHLQRGNHLALPKIIEYGFDDSKSAFAIVYENLVDVKTLEDCCWKYDFVTLLSGLLDVVSCLSELHGKYKMHHGDIHPANILVTTTGEFKIVDFGLADVTRTLSQSQDLEIFAKQFAAPEKLSFSKSSGFPFQADVYSFGRVLEWLLNQKGISLTETNSRMFHRMIAEIPSERLSWSEVEQLLRAIVQDNVSDNRILIETRNGYIDNLENELNNCIPVYDISPSKGTNFLLSIVTDTFLFENVLWLKEDKKLLFDAQQLKSRQSVDQKIIDLKIQHGKKLPFQVDYSKSAPNRRADLAAIIAKWHKEKEAQKSFRESRKVFREEINFYRELLTKEIEVIENNTLRVQYQSFSVSNNEIHFTLKENDKMSSLGFILRHIEEGNDVLSEGFEYVLGANADKKQNKQPVEFAGIPYDFNPKEAILKIKDCERLRKDTIPNTGYLYENSAKKIEEKKRQLDALNKVEKNDVLNPDLIQFLFKPQDLPVSYLDYTKEINVAQKDKDGVPFVYGYNQSKAILNALHRKPLSVIQGPPGTGKTTVITEIVFQILEKHPEAKILITSQTNNAVDQVLENLINNDISVLRLSGITAPKIPVIRKHTLSKKLEGWKQQVVTKSVKNFDIAKAAFLGKAKEGHSLSSSILDLLLRNEDWSKNKEAIEKITTQYDDLQVLHKLPLNIEKAIDLLDVALKIPLREFYSHFIVHKEWIVTVNSLDEKSAINQKLIDSVRVIGATCNHIASKKYSQYNFEFDYVIMDESGKATTAESLVPIIMAKNLVLVGDHRQLKPMLTATREVERWLREKFKKESDELESWDEYFNRPSLFENVISAIDSDYKAQLTECRRSAKEQVGLTSKCFYESEGDEAIVPVDRPQSAEHNYDFPIDSSIFFIDIGSEYKNETDPKSQSSVNRISADVIPLLLEQLNKQTRLKEHSVGVITGYTAQYRLLKKNIDKLKYQKRIDNVIKWNKQEDKFTVSVVDRFQGLERDVIIVDLVKSGTNLQLGFLEVPNRINVALSRQKKLLIIVGDYYGTINATTKRLKGEKAALQKYLELLKPECIVKASQIKSIL